MILSRSIKTLPAATLAVCALAAAAGATSAHAAEPWLKLASGSMPGVLQEGKATAEVQELTATPGVFFTLPGVGFELFVGGRSVGAFGTEIFSLLGYTEASAENIQMALEGEEFYGKGNVVVTGGPAGTAPLRVTSEKKGPVPPLEVSNHAEGGSANARVVTPGQGDGYLTVTVANMGDVALSGATTPVTITDTLPAGLEAVSAEAVAGTRGATSLEVTPAPTCEVPATHTARCTFDGALPPYNVIEMQIVVNGKGAISGEENEADVSGGNAPGVEAKAPISMGEKTPFGLESYEMTAENEGGAADTQAGSHPFQLTTTIALNQSEDPRKPPALVKDLRFKLPPGLIGNPTPFPQCTETQFTRKQEFVNACPNDTAIGVASLDLAEPAQLGHGTIAVPIFNLVPSNGEPARFGFSAYGVPVYLDTSVRTGEDYGVTVSSNNITQLANFIGGRFTFWGVPGNPVHDEQRGWSCIDDEAWKEGIEHSGFGQGPCRPLGEQSPPPFLSMPTSCTGVLGASVSFDSWQEEGVFNEAKLGEAPFGPRMAALDGCNKLPFEPTVKTAPDLEDAATPSGLSVDVHVPQELQVNGKATAESEVEKIEVALPKGVTLNPGGAGGLQACSESEVGYRGKEGTTKEVAFETFSSILPEPFCAKQAKIGTAVIHTPLLPNPLEGAVYLADPAPTGEAGQNPYKSLIAMYLVAEDPVSGTLVKLPMHVELNQETGQVVTTVENPELPFEDAELHFFGGGRAPLAMPGLCGSYTTKAIFTPWSGQEPVTSTSTFNITSGPNGSPCPSSPRPFTPEFNVGTTNNQAGGYSELRTTMGHPDVDQALGALSMTLPPGVSGVLSHVTLCPEPQAAEGTCGPESLIGHTTVTAGFGSTPAVVARPGKVYMTGPYDGAPFGLSIANPAETGPFDLEKGTRCDCIVVRAKVEVDPHTAQLTITSGPLPTMLDGIPLDLQHVSVQVDRPEFTFNPTSCAGMQVQGTISGAEGASVPISTPFQVANCAALKFEPKFAVSTAGKTSKANGASLSVKLTYPSTPQGTEANISKVKVDLPKQLPSRLTTLQKACVAAVFEANPAGCPAASVVGHAKAITPILPVPLEGPAYFVSHGGEAFPSLIVVLQGYGVTVDLVGSTFISKAGITSSTFKTVPDVPVGSFELTLPEGKYSALAADVPAKDNYSLCGQTLKMPTAFVAQNGAEIHQTTPVTVTGCAKTKTKTLTRAQKLKKALKACRKKAKAKRAACERKARKEYAPAKKRHKGKK